MGEKEWSPEVILDVFGDDLARQILVIASEKPVSAEDLGEYLDRSLPTIYRRLNALSEYDLVTEQREFDPDGNHYKTFQTTLSAVEFEIEDGGYTIDMQLRRSLADQFEAFWSDLEQNSPSTEPGETDSPDVFGVDHLE